MVKFTIKIDASIMPKYMEDKKILKKPETPLIYRLKLSELQKGFNYAGLLTIRELLDCVVFYTIV